MRKQLKIGVMGVRRGSFVLADAPLLKDDMKVVAICETDDEAVKAVEKYLTPDIKRFKDFDEFINCGLDAVVLANYFHEHAKFAIRAMEAGVAVLSETTAAPSLGECVDLVEAYERTGTKYMLAANCPYFRAVHAMKERIQSGELGDIVYAEGEYVHPERQRKGDIELDMKNLHWRMTLPGSYYNMHSLGPLMYITNTMPVKVIGKDAQASHMIHATTSSKTFVITQMDNGAVFNTTGCVKTGTRSKWYRIGMEFGTLETERYDEYEEKLIEYGTEPNKKTVTIPSWSSSGIIAPEDEKKYAGQIEGAGHGGIDLAMLYHFIKFMNDEEEPFFNVYRATALSAAGILAWYSALTGCGELDIPDFSKKEDRDKVRGDYRHPFAWDYNDLNLPCNVGEGSFKI